MNEVKTTFKRMALYYLLLAISIIPCADFPDVFPLRNASAIYLLTLCVCLILYYSHRVVPSGSLSFMMKSVSWMATLLILLRGIKYSAFSEVGILARHIWYLYYLPIMLIPLLLFYISLVVAPKKDYRVSKGWRLFAVLTAIMIITVLTNDLHQLVFSFNPGFANWDNDYSYGILFYVITLWQYILYIAAITILVIKCRIGSSKKNAWIIIIPFVIGAVMIALLFTGKMPTLKGTNIIEFPEALIFTVAIVLESCIQLGLIPTNTDYAKLFQRFSISARITDKKGNSVYSSYSAVPLTAEQFLVSSGKRIAKHTVLNKMELPGGFGFWQNDMSELDRLNAELAEAKEQLSQETDLIRLRGELKEKQTKTEQRTLVYDAIAKQTQHQSQLISQLSESARLSDDAEYKEKCRERIALLGAYIKRYANLMLLSQEKNEMELGELELSVSEVLRYLNYCKIPTEFFGNGNCFVSSDSALCVFEAFEILLETNIENLKGAFVNISVSDMVTFKLTAEGLTALLSGETENQLAASGVGCKTNIEDDVAYICFTFEKGGKAQ